MMAIGGEELKIENIRCCLRLAWQVQYHWSIDSGIRTPPRNRRVGHE